MFNKRCSEDGDDGEVDDGIEPQVPLLVVVGAVRYLTVIPLLSLDGIKDVYVYNVYTYIMVYYICIQAVYMSHTFSIDRGNLVKLTILNCIQY